MVLNRKIFLTTQKISTVNRKPPAQTCTILQYYATWNAGLMFRLLLSSQDSVRWRAVLGKEKARQSTWAVLGRLTTAPKIVSISQCHSTVNIGRQKFALYIFLNWFVINTYGFFIIVIIFTSIQKIKLVNITLLISISNWFVICKHR